MPLQKISGCSQKCVQGIVIATSMIFFSGCIEKIPFDLFIRDEPSGDPLKLTSITATISGTYVATLSNESDENQTLSSLDAQAWSSNDLTGVTLSDASTCADDTVLAPEGSCTVVYDIDVSAYGSASPYLSVSTTGADTGKSWSLSEVSTPSSLVVAKTTLSLSPDEVFAEPSGFIDYTLTNSGGFNWTVPTDMYTSNYFAFTDNSNIATNYFLLNSDESTCPVGGTISPDANCSIRIDTESSASLNEAFTLSIYGYDNISEGLALSSSIAVGDEPASGTVTIPTQIMVGASAEVTFTFTNDSSVPLSGMQVTSAAPNTEFTQDSDNSTCLLTSTLTPSQSCTIKGDLSPSTTGQHTVSYALSYNGDYDDLTITGNTTAQGIVAEELFVSIDFTELSPGTLSSVANAGTLGGFFEATSADSDEHPTIGSAYGGSTGLILDGNDYLQLNDSAGGSLTTPPAGLVGLNRTATVEAWVINPSIDIEETIVSWGVRGVAGANMSLNYGNHWHWGAVTHYDAPDIGWNGVPEANKWHHLVYTYDGTTTRVYSDGVLKNSEVISINVAGNTSIQIGAQLDDNGVDVLAPLRGSLAIGKLRIHDGVLSDADILINYNAEKDGFTDP